MSYPASCGPPQVQQAMLADALSWSGKELSNVKPGSQRSLQIFPRIALKRWGLGATGAGRAQMAVTVSTFRKAMVALVAVVYDYDYPNAGYDDGYFGGCYIVKHRVHSAAAGVTEPSSSAVDGPPRGRRMTPLARSLCAQPSTLYFLNQACI
jgi:hypothetical protein